MQAPGYDGAIPGFGTRVAIAAVFSSFGRYDYAARLVRPMLALLRVSTDHPGELNEAWQRAARAGSAICQPDRYDESWNLRSILLGLQILRQHRYWRRDEPPFKHFKQFRPRREFSHLAWKTGLQQPEEVAQLNPELRKVYDEALAYCRAHPSA